MTRKKRVEAWAIVNDRIGVSLRPSLADVRQSTKLKGDRVVRLVEYDAKREAVVRAAIQWTHLALDRSTTGSPGRADAYDALVRAVKKLEGGRK